MLLDFHSHRESYVLDTSCNFCAKERESVPKLNLSLCPECFEWAAIAGNGVSFFGIHPTD
jgi:hypothetical protein